MSYILSRNVPAVPADTLRLCVAYHNLRKPTTINSFQLHISILKLKRCGTVRSTVRHIKVAAQNRLYWHIRYKPNLYTRRLT